MSITSGRLRSAAAARMAEPSSQACCSVKESNCSRSSCKLEEFNITCHAQPFQFESISALVWPRQSAATNHNRHGNAACVSLPPGVGIHSLENSGHGSHTTQSNNPHHSHAQRPQANLKSCQARETGEARRPQKPVESFAMHGTEKAWPQRVRPAEKGPCQVSQFRSTSKAASTMDPESAASAFSPNRWKAQGCQAWLPPRWEMSPPTFKSLGVETIARPAHNSQVSPDGGQYPGLWFAGFGGA